MVRRRVLLLAEKCNPEWPSLPIVGYNYAKAMMEVCDATVVTHVRNREGVERAGGLGDSVEYIDNEWLAGPMYRLASWLRGGDQIAWSTSMVFGYPPYLAFELQARRRFRKRLAEFDLVHRITPMSPTMPSPMAGAGGKPFVLGPLNGNLDWPREFAAENKREREGLRRLRGIAKFMPYARRTQRRSACVMASFDHTMRDLHAVDPARIVPFPEVGFDPEIFHSRRDRAPFAGPGPYEFLFAGRLVPVKVPEAAVRAFVTSEALKPHKLTLVGDGPDRPLLEAIVKEHNASDRVHFAGQQSQREVADAMRRADAFVFPSIRELGAGVVIEAMACGALLMVTDYGAPGALVANGRGVALPLQPMAGLVDANRAAMERCLVQRDEHAALAAAGRDYAERLYSWRAKADYTAALYEAVLSGESLQGFRDYV